MKISGEPRSLHLAVVALLLTLVSSLAFPRSARAAVTSSFDPVTGTLTITGDSADDTIRVWSSNGNIYINGYNPGTGALSAASVKWIIARGGGGDDTIDLSGVHAANFPHLESDSVKIYGEDGNDTLTGSAFACKVDGGNGDDRLVSGIGDDTLDGGPGDDILLGYHGNDRLWGGSGNDTLWGGGGNNVLDGGPGNDTLTLIGSATPLSSDGRNAPLPSNLGGPNILIDSEGDDTLDFSAAASAITIDLDLQNVNQVVDTAGNTVQLQGQLENLIGSAFDDGILLDPLGVPRSMSGAAGNDTLNFDAKGLAATDNGTTITVPGYAPVTYAGFETVHITNTGGWLHYLPLIPH